MSVESVARALRVPGLDPADKLLLVGIANHDGDGGAWPRRATLAMYMGLSERSVKRHLANLVDAGLLTIEYNCGGNRHTPGNRRPNRYIIRWPNPVDNPNLGGTPVSPLADLGGTTGTPRGDTEPGEMHSWGDTAVSPKLSFKDPKKNYPSSVDSPRGFTPVDNSPVTDTEPRLMWDPIGGLLP